MSTEDQCNVYLTLCLKIVFICLLCMIIPYQDQLRRIYMQVYRKDSFYRLYFF